MKLRRVDVRDLREKYERMLVLRTAHARARTDATFVEPDPKREMRLLANAFPGVLREIDTLPSEEIERRIFSLRKTEQNNEDEDEDDLTEAESWMHAIALFHRLARGALETKRWLRGRKQVSDEAHATFFASSSAEARFFEGDLDHIAHPPNGRLMDFVMTKVAALRDLSEDDARVLVFGGLRRRRR